MSDGGDSRDRLLAILAADGVGYSRLMASDQRATLVSLDASRSVFRRHIEAHRGRVIDMAGDSVLAVFESAVSAVQAALDAQAEQSDSLSSMPVDQRLLHRVGIHVGDVIEKTDGSVYGDGVNIASRLEGLAAPGGVVVSEAVHDMVAQRITAHYDDLGPQRVKNIERAVHAFAVRGGSPISSTSGRTRPKITSGLRRPVVGIGAIALLVLLTWGVWTATTHQMMPTRSSTAAHVADAGTLSIVVLPFANLTGDPALAYVPDGLTVSITSDLTRIRDAFIVSLGTAQTFRNSPLTLQQIGADLGVRFVLQGNVQRSGDRLRINAQLADAADNALLWSETFDGDNRDLFALQDKVTTLIGNSMGRELVIRAASVSGDKHDRRTVSDLVLKARALQLRPPTIANFQEIESLYRDALKIDSRNVSVMLGLAMALGSQYVNYTPMLASQSKEKMLSEMQDLVSQAKLAEPENVNVYEAIAALYLAEGNRGEALRMMERVLSLRPQDPLINMRVGYMLYFRGDDPQRARALLHKALDLDPKHPSETLLINLSRVELMLGNYDAAFDWAVKDEALTQSYLGDEDLAVAYAVKGDVDRARAVVKAILREDPAASISRVRAQRNQPGYQAFLEKTLIPAMRLAGMPE